MASRTMLDKSVLLETARALTPLQRLGDLTAASTYYKQALDVTRAATLA